MVALVSEGVATGDPARPFVARIKMGPIVCREWSAPSLESAEAEADRWLRDWAENAGIAEKRVLD